MVAASSSSTTPSPGLCTIPHLSQTPRPRKSSFLKIEVPDSCSLLQLKDTVPRTISSSSSSLHLSLNRKDKIHAPSQEEPLNSLVVAIGNLIFYSLNPTVFTLETLLHKPETAPRDGPTIQDSSETLTSDSPFVLDAEKPPTLDAAELESMEMIDGSDETVVVGTNSEPFFMRRVLKEAPGNNDSGMAFSGSHLLDDSPPTFSSMISLRYTLLDILANVEAGSVAAATTTIKYQFTTAAASIAHPFKPAISNF
ncbi:F-box protein SKIP22 [Glycine soja]